jgi:hypothetical protein
MEKDPFAVVNTKAVPRAFERPANHPHSTFDAFRVVGIRPGIVCINKRVGTDLFSLSVGHENVVAVDQRVKGIHGFRAIVINSWSLKFYRRARQIDFPTLTIETRLGWLPVARRG